MHLWCHYKPRQLEWPSAVSSRRVKEERQASLLLLLLLSQGIIFQDTTPLKQIYNGGHAESALLMPFLTLLQRLWPLSLPSERFLSLSLSRFQAGQGENYVCLFVNLDKDTYNEKGGFFLDDITNCRECCNRQTGPIFLFKSRPLQCIAGSWTLDK